jgi:hypothetical protein
VGCCIGVEVKATTQTIQFQMFVSFVQRRVTGQAGNENKTIRNIKREERRRKPRTKKKQLV